MTLRILRSAIEDLAEGRIFYDLQQIGIGGMFFDSLFSDIESLAPKAGIHPLHYGFHRALATRFPYAIYYKVVDTDVLVYRILDCRRDPRNIAAELTDVL
jgi:hypothetical protein